MRGKIGFLLSVIFQSRPCILILDFPNINLELKKGFVLIL